MYASQKVKGLEGMFGQVRGLTPMLQPSRGWRRRLPSIRTSRVQGPMSEIVRAAREYTGQQQPASCGLLWVALRSRRWVPKSMVTAALLDLVDSVSLQAGVRAGIS